MLALEIWCLKNPRIQHKNTAQPPRIIYEFVEFYDIMLKRELFKTIFSKKRKGL